MVENFCCQESREVLVFKQCCVIAKAWKTFIYHSANTGSTDLSTLFKQTHTVTAIYMEGICEQELL